MISSDGSDYSQDVKLVKRSSQKRLKPQVSDESVDFDRSEKYLRHAGKIPPQKRESSMSHNEGLQTLRTPSPEPQRRGRSKSPRHLGSERKYSGSGGRGRSGSSPPSQAARGSGDRIRRDRSHASSPPVRGRARSSDDGGKLRSRVEKRRPFSAPVRSDRTRTCTICDETIEPGERTFKWYVQHRDCGLANQALERKFLADEDH